MIYWGGGASCEEPALVDVVPWSIKEQLMQEKDAIGFFLSGHLFDEYEREVRCFVKQPIANLQDGRDQVLIAGIVSGLRVISGQRGRLSIFSLEDKSGAIEVVAAEDVVTSCCDALKDDALLVIQCKLAPDRFSGGLRANAVQIWGLPAARCRFGRYLRVRVNGQVPDVMSLLRAYAPLSVPSEAGAGESMQGLKVRIDLQREGYQAEIDLGDQAKFYPSDQAIMHWKMQVAQGQAEIVYS